MTVQYGDGRSDDGSSSKGSALGERQVRTLEPRRGWARFRFKELWDYRELVYLYSKRSVSVRYKQTALGATWAIIKPFLTMVVFTILFGRIAQIPTDDIPRPVFYYGALLPWNYFSQSMTSAASSMVQGSNMLRKVYFPRPVLPLSFALSSLVDMSVGLVMLGGLMAFFGVVPTVGALLIPVFVLLALVTAVGVGLLLAPLNAMYRDVGYAAPFIAQLWMYLSPVIYPSSQVPEAWRGVYFLNPMAGVVEGFRWGLTGKGTLPMPYVLTSVGIALLLLFGGLWLFRRLEGTVIDTV